MKSMIRCLLFVVISVCPVLSWGETETDVESTMLMFVGEDIEVLSIASRREESAWQAPAIADVISREELRERGLRTLSQTLSMTPGFYMAEKEWGSLPYLRGIPNSVLFLYDTVPLNADTSKSLHSLDHQLSLGPVKRIEIIRGPGSVLWGPDAFAGIVNIVPLTGEDIDGAETDISYTAPWDQIGATLNLGRRSGSWDSLLSINGRQGEAEGEDEFNLVRFWDDDEGIFSPEERLGDGELPDARYVDVFGRISWRDRFSISGRVTDNRKPYAISRAEEDLTWKQVREIPGGFVKIETKKDISSVSALRITGFYSQYSPTKTVIDNTYKQKEQTAYGELIYDRKSVFGGSLLTAGISYREKWVSDADRWIDYLPDFLGPGNENQLPRMSQEDYNSRLWSAFAQYGRKIGSIDLSAGVRYDKHDIYENNISYNIAGVYPFSPQWIFKCMLGTAYRTPYASQLIKEDSPELEKIQNFSLQAAWVSPLKRAEASLTGFYNRIEDHIQEDPFAGLSSRNNQDILGFELQGRAGITQNFDLSGNFTWMSNSGPDETYNYEVAIIYRPDGSSEVIYETYVYDYDTGPQSLINLMGTWRISSNATLFTRLSYASSKKLLYPRGESGRNYSGQWGVDAALHIKNLFSKNVGLEISVRNVLDSDYTVPGVYSGIDGAPLETEIVLRKTW